MLCLFRLKKLSDVGAKRELSLLLLIVPKTSPPDARKYRGSRDIPHARQAQHNPPILLISVISPRLNPRIHGHAPCIHENTPRHPSQATIAPAKTKRGKVARCTTRAPGPTQSPYSTNHCHLTPAKPANPWTRSAHPRTHSATPFTGNYCPCRNETREGVRPNLPSEIGGSNSICTVTYHGNYCPTT